MNRFKKRLIGVFDDGDPPADSPAPADPADPADPPADPPPPEDWRQSLSEDLRNNENLKDADNLEDFVANAVKAPDPIDPQSYSLPEHLDTDDFRKTLSEANVTEDGVKKVLSVFNQQQEAIAESEDNRRTEGLTELYDKWGDKKAYNLNIGRSLLSQFDTEGKLAKMLSDSKATHEPTIVNFFFEVGEAMKEDGMLKVLDMQPGKKKSAADVLYPNQGKKS